jgi:hypothetical protein
LIALIAQATELLNVVVILSKADAVDVSVAVTLDLQCIRGTSASPKSFIGRIADSTRSTCTAHAKRMLCVLQAQYEVRQHMLRGGEP